jgi:hypothetical protein
MAKQFDLEKILTIVRSGQFDELVGVVEGDKLECKGSPYRLDEEHERFELAKDVTSFANAHGGVILIGVQTVKDDTLSADIVRKIGTFSKSHVNTSQYRDVLKEWIYPSLQKLEIEWFPSARNIDEGVVAILIGDQDQLWRPFVITRTFENSGKTSTVLFGYAERSLDRSAPTGIQQLHLLLRDGLRFGTSLSLQPLSPSIPAVTESRSSTPPAPPQENPSALDRSEKILASLVRERVRNAEEAVQLTARPVFVLAATPCQSTNIPRLFSSRDSDVVRLLEDPPELRSGGFGPDAGLNSRIVEQGEARRTVIDHYKLLEIWKDGTVVSVAEGGADFLSWASRATNMLRINQLVLVETTYLFVKLVNDVLAGADPAPLTVYYLLGMRRMTIQEPAILFPGPLSNFPHGQQQAQGSERVVTFSASFGTDPRLIAFKLVAQVYHWFGFDEDNIPYAEQLTSGERIISPDQIIELNIHSM